MKIKIGSDGMKTLGMIGGTSWHSTHVYYRNINKLVNERMPPSNPPILMYSLNADLMRRNNWDEISQAYIDIATVLQNAGADGLIICANTPHKVFPQVQPLLDIPILHIADAVAKAAKNQGLSNLALLGTKYVTQDGFIKDRLQDQHGIRTIVSEASIREEMHQRIITELVSGIFKEHTREFFLSEMSALKDKGADGVILGCTELPILIKPEDFDLPLLDTTYLHCEMAADFIVR